MFNEDQKKVISEALSIIESSLKIDGFSITDADSARDYCRIKLAHFESEKFGVLFLNNKHQLISFDIMFHGTIDSASVYPREIAKAALGYNAAAVIITHNHPSGWAEPSSADKNITNRISESLGLFDIKVLDHIVVSANESVSFAHRGLL